MNNHKKPILITAIFSLAFLQACSADNTNSSEISQAPPPAATQAAMSTTDSCQSEPGIDYLCGLLNAEDLHQIGTTSWLLASGMNGDISGGDINGRIHLINAEERSFSILFPGESPQLTLNAQRFPDCPADLDFTDISVHGLSLREQTGNEGLYDLYITSHGGREAIEAFELDMRGAEPAIRWVGCVLMPEDAWVNSVAILSDGGFVTTKFMDPTAGGMDAVTRGEVNGYILQWRPGGNVEIMPGTEMSGANGIVVDANENYMYAAAFGSAEILRFDLGTEPLQRTSVSVGITADNLRWTDSGTILVSGGLLNAPGGCEGPGCANGWAVYEIDPQSMEAERIAEAGTDAALQGASATIQFRDELWVGTYAGDRVAILPRNQ